MTPLRARWACCAGLLVVAACTSRSSTLTQITHNAAPLGSSRVQYVTSPAIRTLVTDPDHDSVWIIPADGNPEQQIELGVGEEPGDLLVTTTSTGDTVAFVSVHNGGAVLAIPLPSSTTAPLTYTRIPVCRSPRGLDSYPMPAGQTLFVACADGALVTVDVATQSIVSKIALEDDLKDVVVIDGVNALVTRFRTAQVLFVNLGTGSFSPSLPPFQGASEFESGPVALPTPPVEDGGSGVADGGGPVLPPGGSDAGGINMQAEIAWQMIPVGGIPRSGGLIAHQLASVELIHVAATDGGQPPGVPGCGSGMTGCSPSAQCTDTPSGPVCTCPPGLVGDGITCMSPTPCMSGSVEDPGCLDAGQQAPPSPTPGPVIAETDGGGVCFSSPDDTDGGQQGYGPGGCGASTCGAGVVAAGVTLVAVTGGQAPTILPLAVPGPMIPPLSLAPGIQGSQAFIAGLGNGTVATINLPTGPLQGQSSAFACLTTLSVPDIDALGSAGGGQQLIPALTRQQPGVSAQVVWLNMGEPPGSSDFERLGAVLPYAQVNGQAGRDLFHSATPSMMSCASCHPGGREDGHVWNFDPMGLRRTPALGGGLLATAPFHWDGAEHDISQLMTDVFVGRMSGPAPAPAQIGAISEWLNGLPEAQANAAPDPASVTAGQALFESAEVGCTNCHSGEHFTNNQTLDVGTGGAFQVPSLRGVGSRPPYLHDGRAATLEDRFDPTLGGGDLHGHTSQLSPAQIEDLVAYLRSL